MELLENREVLSNYVISQGGFGYGILDIEGWTFKTQPSNVFYLNNNDNYVIVLANVEVHTGSGKDKIELHNAATVYGGAGNDTILGSNQADLIFGEAGEDVCFGGDGVDSVFGGDGDDFLVGGWSSTQSWAGNRSTRVIEALKGQITAGSDSLNGGNGFNLLYNTSPQFTYGVSPSNTAYVSSLSELNTALTQSIDTIYITGDITGNIIVNKAVNIIGINNPVVHGKFKVDSPSFYLENIRIDITGQDQYSDGFVNGFRRNTVLNNVEIYGQNLTNTAALYFYNVGVTSQSVMLNSYVHDTYGDGISTGGYGSTVDINAQSRLELFNVRGARSGPAANNQVLTAHAAFNVVDVYGNYSDAQSNVIAPDSVAVIDLYWTRVSAGTRSASVDITHPTTIFSCTLLDQTRFSQYGIMEKCYIEGKGGYILIDTYGTFKNNYVKRITGTNPIRAYSGSVVDNVFESWPGQIINLGATLSGNTFL